LPVGGTVAGAGNIVGGNDSGVVMDAGSNTVQGNYIGTDPTGTINLGNVADPGVRINNSSNNLIGGVIAGAGNVIAFNAFGGVSIQNFGGPATGNAVEGNAIYGNVGLGIDLTPNGSNVVIPNTPCGPHAGSNNLQNFPVLTSAISSGGSTTIQGSLNSIASTTFRVELYASPACDASGFGEGQTFLGFTNVTTDGACNATLNVSLPVAVTVGQVVTATATDPGNNTSQFSACRVVSGALPPPQSAAAIPTLGDLALLALALAVLTLGLGAMKRES
jgi:titin